MCPRWLYLIPAAFLMTFGLCLMAWLTPGPRQVGGVVLDVHTFLLGSLWAILGYQVLWLWLQAQIYGWTSGLWPSDRLAPRLFRRFRLERWLIAGGVLLAGGLGMNLWLVGEWYRENLGPLEVGTTLRLAFWGFTLMILGAQTIFGSFFLGMIDMARKSQEYVSKAIARQAVRTLSSAERTPVETV
jgi:hypothetical protein